MAIGEILLSAFLEVLFEKLASLGLRYAQREGAPPFSGISIDLLNKWKKMLVTINAVLDDAEDKQLSGKGPVKLWLDDVRDLAYDMEDLLDEFEIEATRAKSETESSTSGGLAKWKFPFVSQHKSSISNPNLPLLVSETEVQKINDRLEEIVTRKAQLSLTENAVNRSDYTDKRLKSTCLPETRFFGREKEEEEILNLLTDEANDSDATLSIVPIVGMGGVGKTALAQQLYNDANVSSHFKTKAWVCVSDVFDVLDITKTILRSITGSSCEGKDLNEFQVKLKESLLGKKFLVVLDDVWNDDYGRWTDLLKPFEVGAKGSKILITTRNLSVVSIGGASPYPLEMLSLDNCTSLLAFHAFGATNFESQPDLETIGKKLAKKCKGLPLAAKMLGGALRNERNPRKWKAILNSRIWHLLKGKKDEVLPVLKLSYVHLPSYLKRCFAYCAVFPKDYEIERDELVLLWIAEGFLDEQKAKEDILSLGFDHFDELVSRSFLQRSSFNASKFSMHDLLNDLAKSIAGGTCFSSGESQLVGNEDDASLEKARHASFISPWYVTSQRLRAYHGMKVLRSLIMVRVGSNSLSISDKVLDDLLKELKYLRVLSVCHCSITEVPNYVGELKHLRYLNFSHTDIETLPESIGGLCKLQALILRGCQKLSKLPPSIAKLVSLQFLDVRDTWSLKEMPLGISNLQNLTILSKFVVGTEKGLELKELKNLPHLQGELFISELQRVEKVRDAVDANLFGKEGLSNLFLHWDEDFGNLRNDKRDSQVIEYLRPHTNLENLTIWNYSGAIFPSWLDGPSFSKLVSLCLRGCPNVTSLPSLGQLPSLKELSLEGLHAIRMIGSEFYGGKRPFSSLTTLKFEEMLSWKDWSPYARGPEEEVPFSCLQHLVVRSCPSLVGTLPRQLDLLRKLEIHSCPHLNISTSEVSLPSLDELYLEDCNHEILKSFVNVTSLTILGIENIAELVWFDRGCTSRFVKLKELRIVGCEKLTNLWQDGNEMLNLTCLQKLAIQRCPRFRYFVAGGGEIELPYNLERMEFLDCKSLEKLPSNMHTLRNLSIEKCPKLMGLTIAPHDPTSNNPTPQLAALKTLTIRECEGVESLELGESLESLTIWECKNLGSLRCLHTLSHLTTLEIWSCPALEIEEEFPPLPITLSDFFLVNCPKIKALPNQWHHLTSLHRIYIYNCPNINCFPKGGFPPNLEVLEIEGCENVKQPVREWGLPLLTSLVQLFIYNCPNIECFPKGGFPPNLRSLGIGGCENVKQPVREWGLPLLTSLKHLQIDFGRSMGGGGGEKVSFPYSEEDDEEDAWSLLFPSSLTNLRLRNMRKVEKLSSGLRNHLSSLQVLRIEDCPELRYLPEDGLPPSLQQLYIYECSNLKEGCSKLTGHNWPLIQDIPYIEIDYKRIR